MPTPWTYSYGGEFSEQWEHLTDVEPAPTGEETRRKLRPNPRTVLRFDALEQGDARRQLEDALHAFGSGDWYAPLLSDSSVLSSAWTIGDPAVLAVDTTNRRFRIGGQVLLTSPASGPRVYDVVTVSALTGSSLTLTGSPTHSWPAGTRVLPLGLARFVSVPPLSRFTADATPFSVAFRLKDASAAVAADAGDATYRSVPVFEWRADWSVDPVFEATRELLTVDNGTGPIDETDMPEMPLSKVAASFSLVGRAEIVAFRSLLAALAGRWGSIWVPTFAQDFRVTAALASADTTLDVAYTGISGRALKTNRRDIRVEFVDGTILYRRITAAAIHGDGERLSLDSALGVNASTAQVRVVSFLALMRQDADVNLLRYWTSEVMETDLVFRGFRDDGI